MKVFMESAVEITVTLCFNKSDWTSFGRVDLTCFGISYR